ncbi:MAG: hypothetical protein JNM77_05090 [Pseudonocardia sp.]|nr:hypothetical protein [Pseudonocardia sp.]
MNATGFVVMLGFAALMVLAGNVGLVCGRARARAGARRRLGGPPSRPRQRPTSGTAAAPPSADRA